MNMPKTSDTCQENEIFGCDSNGEETVRQISQSDNLLSQFHIHLKSLEFGRAEALIPDIVEIGFENVDSLCNQIEEAYEKQAVIVREQTYDHIASTLPGLQSFSAELAAAGSREVILQWITSPDSKADCYYLVRKEIEPPTSIDDGQVVFKGTQQSFSDITIPIGIPCCYSVFSSYKERINPRANVLSSPVLYAPAIESFQVDIEGCSTFAIVNLTWKIPSYDSSAKLALELWRVHGDKRRTIYLTYDQSKYTDDEVVVGETYRYELILVVAGKRLEPIVREVTIKALPELPMIDDLRVHRNDATSFHALWTWPDRVDVVKIQDENGNVLKEVSQEEHDERGVEITIKPNTTRIRAQALRRFGVRICSGPLSNGTVIPGCLGKITWLICRMPRKTMSDWFCFWRKRNLCIQLSVQPKSSSRKSIGTNEHISLKIFKEGCMDVQSSFDAVCGKKMLWPIPSGIFARGDRISLQAPEGYDVIRNGFGTVP